MEEAKKLVNFIRDTLETVAVASVRSIKEHVFKVVVSNDIKVSNLPPIQKIEGKVEVSNPTDLKGLEKKVDEVTSSIKAINVPEIVSVKNFPKYPDPVKEIKVSNPVTEVTMKNLGEISKLLQAVKKSIDLLPRKYPEFKIPPFPKPEPFPDGFTVLNPVKEVKVSNFEPLIGTDPNRYLPVRLSDGEKFYDAINEVATVAGGRYAYQKSDGARGSALMDSHNRAIVYVDEFRLNDRKTINGIKYLGFQDRYGNWYINTIEGTGVDAEDQKFRFASNKNNPGVTTYVGAWNNKLSLIYGRYADAFGE